jgi:hypothetical protein
MVLVVLNVLWAVVVCAVFVGVIAVSRRDQRSMLVVTVLALLALALRAGVDGPFYGLEYEDAYVYAAAAKHLAATGPTVEFGGLTVCAVGTGTTCAESEFYPGHLPGFPALLYAVESILGSGPWVPPLVSAVVSSIAAIAVWWAAFAIYQSTTAAAVAMALFATTPAFALYGGSATSEGVSSLPTAVSIATAAMVRRSHTAREWWIWHALSVAAVMLAVAIRRENAVLLGILPAAILLVPPTPVRQSFARSAMVVVWLGVAVGAVTLIFPSIVSEVGEYGQFSFGLHRLFNTVPMILRALCAPEWFGLIMPLALVAMCSVLLTCWRRSDAPHDTTLLLLIASVALVMLTLYGSHVRSTYQLMGVALQPYDFLRYLSNIGVALCLLAPAGSGLLDRLIIALPRPLTLAVVCGYVILGSVASWSLRTSMLADERFVRTDPAIGAIAAAVTRGNREPVVTLEPLVAQLHAAPETLIIGLPALTSARVAEVGGRVLYLRQDHYQTVENQRRYAKIFSALPERMGVELRSGPGWTVIQMGE